VLGGLWMMEDGVRVMGGRGRKSVIDGVGVWDERG
jgi:hypothetical protein